MIVVIDGEGYTPRDRALMALAQAHLIRRETLPYTISLDGTSESTLRFLDSLRGDTRPADTVVSIDFGGEPVPLVNELAARLRAALAPEAAPARVNERDLVLTRLAWVHARGEALPATVAVNGAVLATASFLAGFTMDARTAWPALAEHVEHVQTPTVGEVAASLCTE